jgi:peptidoglycan glycosyltransferase
VNRRIRRLGLAIMVLFGALFINLNYLQVVRADDLANDPRNGRVALKQFTKARGDIVTSDGVVLAHSVPSNDEFKFQRVYPQGALFAPITGFFSFTFGADGAEKAFSNDLTAHRPTTIKSLSDIVNPPEVTNNVTLTVSKKLQQVASDALGQRKGAVVAIDPRTGAILALVNFPTYDPNVLSGHSHQEVQAAYNNLVNNPDNPMLARAYQERYPPGSTFKVVTSSAVFDKKPELATTSYPVLRALPLPNTNGLKLANFDNEACGGTLPALLKVSCNTGFAQIGLDLGADALSGEAQGFGFGTKPPFDLPRPALSVFPAAAAFTNDKPGLAKSAIGQQDVAASPLQMALVAAGIANGGVIMKPHVLQDERDDQGNVVRTSTPEPWMTATSPETAAKVRDMMVGVVQGGTGTKAAIPGVTVAAKTGTAQTTAGHAHAWMIAFAPAEQPTVAVAVIVESQQAGDDSATGGRVAAPIVKAVLQAALGK